MTRQMAYGKFYSFSLPLFESELAGDVASLVFRGPSCWWYSGVCM